MGVWASDFGKEYTDRNLMTMEEMDAMYLARYGVSRTDMNSVFLGSMNRNMTILEVGCGAGAQLEFLREMGFKNLYGLELSPYAWEIARGKEFCVALDDVCKMPFKDNSFDLVFTSGLLIHIPPDDLPKAVREIHRCSKRWIWGFEYYADEMTAIEYRGQENLLWKANYPGIFRTQFADLFLVREQSFPYKGSDNIDVMFLLKKVRGVSIRNGNQRFNLYNECPP